MKGHGEKLSRKQEVAIAALLTSPTTREAAAAAGVSDVTLWRWMQVPAFSDAYRHARGEELRKAMASLHAASGEAVESLRRNRASGIPSVEVHAARAILEFTLRAAELLDLTDRVELLERGERERQGTAAAAVEAQP